MPRNLPPIAPPAPVDAAPNEPTRDAPATPRQVVSAPVVSALEQRVADMRRDPRVAMVAPNPMTVALWTALEDDPATVAQRHAATLRALQDAAAVTPSYDPSAAPPRMLWPGMPRSALQAIADAQVVKAMQGDAQAAASIADRIEGKVGNRRGDVDPEAEARRDEIRRSIESVVRHMAQRATGEGAEPVVIDVIPDTTGE